MTDPSEAEAIRFNEYLDEELDSAARAAFEAELESDHGLRERFEAFARPLAALSGLEAPEVDLTLSVQRKIRRRSRGRYFSERSLHRERMQTQLFIVIALIVLVGIVVLASSRQVALLFAPEIQELDGSGASAEPVDRLGDDPPPVPVVNVQPRGIVESGAIAPIVRRDFVYTVYTDLSVAAAGRALAARFGAAAVRIEDDRAIVSVARGELIESVTRASDLGSVSRTLAVVDPTLERREFFVEHRP